MYTFEAHGNYNKVSFMNSYRFILHGHYYEVIMTHLATTKMRSCAHQSIQWMHSLT